MRSVREVLTASAEIGVEVVTLYSFSSENWKRPGDEIEALMQLCVMYCEGEREELASQNVRVRVIGRRDGLRLIDTAVTCVVKCAPPQNKPATAEIVACRPWLEAELAKMRRLRVVIALGQIALRGYCAAAALRMPRFQHADRIKAGGVDLLTSYHPSRQNTNTGRLTRPMFHRVFRLARRILDES